jgi:multiple sugar transport system ATP-binding protein
MASITLKNVPNVLAIRDREFVVLAGPGSSEIVRLIAGLENVSQGEILFDERKIHTSAPHDRDVALVSHDYLPYPGLSVFENLAIGLRRRKFVEAEIKKRIAAVASALRLETDLEANAQSLSPEQRRLVGLGRAMVRQPKVYLFDNPFAGLEPAAARHGRAEIVKLYQRSSATIVYATTDPAEALALGERTVVFADDAIQQDDSAKNIYDAPANLAVAKFFGDPPMNLIAGTLKQERNALVFSEAGDGTIAMPLTLDRFSTAQDFAGKPVVLGFHPEDVEIGADAGFRALVEGAENTGAGTNLYLQTGAHGLIAMALRWDQEAGGHRIQFRIALEKAHLFDPATGQRVTRE